MSTYTALLPLRPFQPFDEGTPERKPKQPRRRTTPDQGRALEALGHAIEYLIDSRLVEQWESASDAEAVHLLMSCSLAVHSGEQTVEPWHQRVQRGLVKRLNRESTPPQH